MNASPEPPAHSLLDPDAQVRFLTRLFGTETDDAFAKRAHHVVNRLSKHFERGAPLAADVPSRLGSYVVGPAIGRGGMGMVFRAVHQSTGKVVAIKLARAGSDVARFLEAEALALGGLDHRGVVQVFDHGVQDGYVWLAMQMVHGRTLAAVIGERKRGGGEAGKDGGRAAALGPAEVRTFVTWFRDLAIALAAIHDRGVVHRDIKPANLMIAADGTPFLIDFGLSLDVVDHTIVDTLAGTVPYMSPEQVLALAELDGRTDIYSLAVCMFELLSGGRLVRDDEPRTGLLRQIAFSRVPRISVAAPWVGPEYDGVFAKALAKDPKDRYRGARELATDLDRILAGREPIHARTSWASRLHRHRKTLAAAIVVLVAAGVLGVPAWRRHVELSDLRARFGRASGPGNHAPDEARDALEHALEMAPAYGDDAAFQDAYGKALADLAPGITRRLFQRAALTPSNAVANSPTGRVGALARRSLAAAKGLSEGTRSELIVQAMFADVLGARYDDALALAGTGHDARDERIQQLTAVANVLGQHPVDPEALKLVRDADFANLSADRLCCRGILLLGLSDKSATPLTADLARLARALEGGIETARADRDTRNLLAGLLALTQLRLVRPAAAEELLNGRLVDAESGPTSEERPAMLVLAAAAGYRRLVRAEHADPSMALVVEHFLAAAEAEPGAVLHFVEEVGRDADVEALGGAFDHAAAEFFEELVAQHPPVRVFSESLLYLLRFAEQDWGAHSNWNTFLVIADSVRRDAQHIVLDALTGDLFNRWLWIEAIPVALLVPAEGEDTPEMRLKRSVSYRNAAVRLLPAPHDEFETSLARVVVLVRAADSDALAGLGSSIGGLRARTAGAEAAKASDHFLEMLKEVLADAEETAARSRTSSK